VTKEVVILVFAAGSGSLALWIDVRFPRLGPAELRGAVLHAVCAYGLFLVSDAIFNMVAGSDPWRRLIALFAIDLSVLTYMLIACLWVLKVFRGALSAAR
jgi:hypothetical protein